MNLTRAGKRPSFTLIELLGVIMIMALLSGAASVMINGSRHNADFQNAIEQIEQADSSCRTLARSSNQPVSLSFSLASDRLSRVHNATTSTLGNLPGDVKITRVRIGEKVTDFGARDIAFNPRGCSASYAVRLLDSTGQSQWILFAGLTGQRVKVNDEELDSILELAASPAGTHAH